MDKIKVFGYARKSPDDREDTQISIANQIKQFEYVCQQKDWKLIKVFQDVNTSGSKRDRKGFNKLIEEVKANQDISIILIKDSSRFARDSSFFSDVLIDLLVIGKRFYSCMKGGYLDPEDLADKITSVVDEDVVIRGRKYSRMLFDQKKEDKLPPIKSPFGYKNDSKTKTFKIINKQAHIVSGVCQDFVSGLDYKEIIKKYKINPPKYYRIIRGAKNGIYNGLVYYEKKIKDSKGNVIRNEVVTYKGNYPSILSEEAFQKLKVYKD